MKVKLRIIMGVMKATLISRISAIPVVNVVIKARMIATTKISCKAIAVRMLMLNGSLVRVNFIF